jgi:hypothetical protein
MPVPSAITDLSQTAGSNSPTGGESPTTADDYFRAFASFIALLRDGKGLSVEVDLASGATCDIGGQNSPFVRITGTTTITSFGTNYNGPRFVRFAGALTLTHNATTLILPGGANITTAAGDTCVVTPISGGWVVLNYQRAANLPAFSAYQSVSQSLSTSTATKLLFQTEEFDTAGAYDSATNSRFQPLVAGYYEIRGAFAINSTQTSLQLMAYKNGALAKYLQFVPSTASSGVAGSALILLNGSSDYVELYGSQAAAAQNTAASATQTYFQAHLARAA